ncbi:Integrase core domain protein [Calycomorphotria hydatis]|uniref:Integrase core domain protein n=1 Tax=Calycomorphotria hydatis TaxID=2528027 RepID=A0A517TA35_9PLAN|nr:Integrase core domain protein [Calycomorphotria hydatis]
MDFMTDELFDGRRIRLLTIVDHFSRESLAIDVEQRFRGQDVVHVLERIASQRSLPKTIRVDNAAAGGLKPGGARRSLHRRFCTSGLIPTK